jgi:tetratricopeptide (TPR) repeat protein
MKAIVLICVFFVGGLSLYGQHVPTLKPTNERLTKVNSKAVVHFKKGIESYNSNNLVLAKQEFKTAVQIDESFAEAYINLSKIYEKEDNLDSAKSVIKDAINSMIPLNSRAFEQLGRVSYKSGDYDAAVYNYQQAVSLDNKNNDYQYYSGVSLLANYNAEEALGYMSKAVELDGTIRNKIGLSNAQITLGKYTDAISTIKGISNYEFSSEACVNLAIASHGLGKNEETDEYLKMAESNGGANKSEFHNLSGLINSVKANNEIAKSSFDKAIEMDPKNYSYYNDRASHLIRIENYTDALTDLNRALEIKPDFSKAYYNRGIAKEMLRDEKGACLDWEYAFFLGYTKAEELLNNPICN